MITKHERKVYAWLAKPRVSTRQFFRMRKRLRADLLRLMMANGWIYAAHERMWYSPAEVVAHWGLSKRASDWPSPEAPGEAWLALLPSKTAASEPDIA